MDPNGHFSAQLRALMRVRGKFMKLKAPGVSASSRESCHLLFFISDSSSNKARVFTKIEALMGKAAGCPMFPFSIPFTSCKVNQEHSSRCVVFAVEGEVGKFIMKASCLETIYNKFLLEKDIWLTTVFFCLCMTKYSKNSKCER